MIVLNLALLALASALGWLLRTHLRQARAYERATLRQTAHPKPALPPPPAPMPAPVPAAQYLDVAQRMLFSKDRNPNVILPPPPAPPPEPPMPALPAYHGQMALFGDPVVFLSTDTNGTQKSYRVGEKIGPFELVGFDNEKITLAWNGKKVERTVAELAPKVAAPQQAQAPAPTPAPQPAASGVVALGGPKPTDLGGAKKNPVLGNDSGGGYFSCVPNDNSPSGTIVDGYKKVISQGMFGQVCHWEQAK
jgi:hypothetical protein